MKKYISISLCGLQSSMIYRWNFLINIFSGFIITILMFYVWYVVFQYNDNINGYTWEIMKSYLFIGFICNSALSWRSETKMSRKIITGDITSDLIKPINFMGIALAESIGSGIVENLVSIGLMLVVALFIFDIAFPSSLDVWLLLFISLFFSFLIKFIIIYISSLICFWTENYYGVAKARATITDFFSGALVPLELLPSLLKNIAGYLPFQGIVFIPSSVFIGKLVGIAAVKALFIQLLWIIALWYLSNFIWKRAIRQITIHGG